MFTGITEVPWNTMILPVTRERHSTQIPAVFSWKLQNLLSVIWKGATLTHLFIRQGSGGVDVKLPSARGLSLPAEAH